MSGIFQPFLFKTGYVTLNKKHNGNDAASFCFRAWTKIKQASQPKTQENTHAAKVSAKGDAISAGEGT